MFSIVAFCLAVVVGVDAGLITIETSFGPVIGEAGPLANGTIPTLVSSFSPIPLRRSLSFFFIKKK